MSDGRGGETLSGTLAFRVFHCADDDVIDVDINGAAVSPDKIKRTMDRTEADLPWTWFEIALADCPPFCGDNELGLTWQSAAEKGLNVPYVEELDLVAEGEPH